MSAVHSFCELVACFKTWMSAYRPPVRTEVAASTPLVPLPVHVPRTSWDHAVKHVGPVSWYELTEELFR